MKPGDLVKEKINQTQGIVLDMYQNQELKNWIVKVYFPHKKTTSWLGLEECKVVNEAR